MYVYIYVCMFVCVYSSICNIIRCMGNVSGDEANNNTVVAKDPSTGNRRNDEGFEARQMTRDRIKVRGLKLLRYEALSSCQMTRDRIKAPICPKCYV